MGTKTVLITGATSGIGKATAYRLAQSKMQLIICGRRTKELEKIREDLSKLTAVTSLCFDVSDNTQVTKSIESIPDNFQQIDILINNAGNAASPAGEKSSSAIRARWAMRCSGGRRIPGPRKAKTTSMPCERPTTVTLLMSPMNRWAITKLLSGQPGSGRKSLHSLSSCRSASSVRIVLCRYRSPGSIASRSNRFDVPLNLMELTTGPTCPCSPGASRERTLINRSTQA